MIDLGKGVSVDFKKHPYVFGIEGWDPIRVQKGTGRITGVSLEQLEIIVAVIKGSKDGQNSNITDVGKTTSRKIGAVSSTGTRTSKVNRHKSK